MRTARKEFTASEARSRFSEVFDAAYHDGPVIIRKNSKSVAVVNIELLQLLAAIEDAHDAAKAKEAMAEYLREGGTSLAEMKRELGIE
jgi:prevent-host-death family protein